MDIRGSIGSAKVTTSGLVDISLANVTGPVEVNAREASEIFIEAESDSAEGVVITGTTEDASKVQHAGGRCALSNQIFSSGCNEAAVPSHTVEPLVWTRGITIIEAFSCHGHTGISASSFIRP